MLLMAQETVRVAVHTVAAFGRMRPLAVGLGSLNRHAVGWLGVLGAGSLVATATHRQHAAENRCEQEERLRRETAAYLALDLSLDTMERKQLASELSRTIATRSSFSRAALLLRDGKGPLAVAGSVGVDDLSIDALNRWGAAVEESPELTGNSAPEAQTDDAPCGFSLQLERRSPSRSTRTIGALSCSRVHIVPISSARGLVGAIAVCGEPSAGKPGTQESDYLRQLEPIEALALRLGTRLSRPTRRTGPRMVRSTPARGGHRTPDANLFDISRQLSETQSDAVLPKTMRQMAQHIHDLLSPDRGSHPQSAASAMRAMPSARLFQHATHGAASLPSLRRLDGPAGAGRLGAS